MLRSFGMLCYLLLLIEIRQVPLVEQVETFCCGLPKELRDYCIKKRVESMTQMIEIAQTGYALLTGQMSGFKGNVATAKKAGKEDETTEETKPAATKFKGRMKGIQRRFSSYKTPEERKVLMDNDQCFTCGEVRHRFYEWPKRKRNSSGAKDEPMTKEESKKPKPSAGLVPDMVGERRNDEASELCRAWGKVRDQTALIFFDSGARANFITPELATQLGIRSEEMGAVHEASLAAPRHSVAVTPIIGKLGLHVQGYVDSEDFYIMPLEGCDVLLDMPWCHKVRAVVDTLNRKISLTHKGKSIVLDVKLKGESVPVVSASAISSV